MAVHHPHLQKALRLAQLRGQALDSLLRNDIRSTIRREAGERSSGGDFHGPFWADAKAWVFHERDLRGATEGRINQSRQRQRLYPMLEEGFSRWWTPFRAQTNEPVEPFQGELRGSLRLPDIDVELKVHNLLCLTAGENFQRFIYPYFTDEPDLGDEAAAFGLAALSDAFPEYDPGSFVLLDVLRSRGFTFENTDVPARTLHRFSARYRAILDRWDTLREDYD